MKHENDDVIICRYSGAHPDYSVKEFASQIKRLSKNFDRQIIAIFDGIELFIDEFSDENAIEHDFLTKKSCVLN